MSFEQEIADKVRQRAEDLLPPEKPPEPLDNTFVKDCLDANERGDGVMFATINRDKFLYNTTPKDGEWFAWNGKVWEKDDFRASVKAVEEVAVEYLKQAGRLADEIDKEKIISKRQADGWKIGLKENFEKRASRLRTETGARKTLYWAPILDTAMACREDQFDTHPWLLPVQNGVIDLQTGALTRGRPQDKMTKCLAIEYTPHADHTPWHDVLCEIAGSEEVPAFLKRFFGYAITGHSHEQYIGVFVGPGRNGKGIMFNLLAEVMGPFYYEINKGMLLEQRNEPSPAAASEHLYSLKGKRIIVGSETNQGQRIDGAAVKNLTGEDMITCRPLFKQELSYYPTHSLFLRTNHVPVGMTRDFAMVQRLLLIEFPFMYVDDPEAEARLYPTLAEKFRTKDPDLKNKLRAHKQGILTWLVEGCREWQEKGLAPPDIITAGVARLQKEEDYVTQFVEDCLDHIPDNPDLRLPCTGMYAAFKWWWSNNLGERDKKEPAMKTINKMLRERGYLVEKIGGKTFVLKVRIKLTIAAEIGGYDYQGPG